MEWHFTRTSTIKKYLDVSLLFKYEYISCGMIVINGIIKYIYIFMPFRKFERITFDLYHLSRFLLIPIYVNKHIQIMNY